MRCILVLLALLVPCVLCQEEYYDIDFLEVDEGVTVTSGQVLGLSTRFYGQRARTYLGIPYAAPPIGPLKFRKPVAVEPWNGTMLADTFPPACPQYSLVDYPWYDAEENKNEDCLYLNIWSPHFNVKKHKLPVIFWIHGGGFTVGSNRIQSQNGLGLAVLGPNIVVAPNYRLNALGFFSSETEEAPGNVGLYDLVHALKWVRENIVSFGGDPDHITLMGEGAGAAAVSLFMISPLTRGMFDKAIMQSGSFLTIKGKGDEYNIRLGQRLAEAVNCTNETSSLKENPKETVECLRDVDGQELARVLSSFSPHSTASFLPQWGDEFMPRDPAQILKEKDFTPVPLLLGNNRDEGAFLLTSWNAERFGVFGEKNPEVSKEEGSDLIRKMFAHLPDPESVVHQYLDDVDDGDTNEIRRQVYTAVGDFYVTCPLVYFAEAYGRDNSTVEYYIFAQRPRKSVWAEWMGVTHHDEAAFIFGRPIDGYNYNTFLENYNGELGLSYRMLLIWSHFAKEGKGMDMWKNFSSHHHQYVLLKYNVKKKMRGPGPHLDNCNFFRDYYGF